MLTVVWGVCRQIWPVRV